MQISLFAVKALALLARSIDGSALSRIANFSDIVNLLFGWLSIRKYCRRVIKFGAIDEITANASSNIDWQEAPVDAVATTLEHIWDKLKRGKCQSPSA